MGRTVSEHGRRRYLQGGLALVSLGLLSACGVSALPRQLPAKVPRIGYLASGSPASSQAFREGLSELGYSEGRTILIEERFSESPDELRTLAAQLVALPVDLIVSAGGWQTIEAALAATRTIPIVFAGSGDPVQAGYVASLARPGGNATGTSNLQVRVGAKRLELLRDIVPGLSRVLSLSDTADPATVNGQIVRETAQALGLQLIRPELRTSADVPAALEMGLREHAEALLVGGQAVVFREVGRIIDFAAQHRLPAMYDRRQAPEAGGLMSYGPDILALYRRAAAYVDRILKGANPADLPVEQPTKFDLVINLQTARAIGLTIPPSVLQQATEVIQ